MHRQGLWYFVPGEGSLSSLYGIRTWPTSSLAVALRSLRRVLGQKRMTSMVMDM